MSDQPPIPPCPVCLPPERRTTETGRRRGSRMHSESERRLYHPLAIHGFNGQVWTDPRAEKSHIDEVRQWKGEQPSAQ
jgi:hypothetical protein